MCVMGRVGRHSGCFEFNNAFLVFESLCHCCLVCPAAEDSFGAHLAFGEDVLVALLVTATNSSASALQVHGGGGKGHGRGEGVEGSTTTSSASCHCGYRPTAMLNRSALLAQPF